MAEGGVDRCFAALVDRLSSPWGLAAGPHTPRRKMLPLSSLRRTYRDRVLATGDAAGLVKPTTGGGIYYAIVSGRMAGSAMSRALVSGKLAARDLAEYQRQWRKSFMAEFGAQLALRMLAHRMSDEAIDRLFDLAIHDGVMPIVRRAARFNEHRGFIRELLRHPPARRLLFRGVASSIT
jgi:flavin-dependent dehydrogenase